MQILAEKTVFVRALVIISILSNNCLQRLQVFDQVIDLVIGDAFFKRGHGIIGRYELLPDVFLSDRSLTSRQIIPFKQVFKTRADFDGLPVCVVALAASFFGEKHCSLFGGYLDLRYPHNP